MGAEEEDLFDQLVMPFVQRIDKWLAAHVARYVDAVNSGQKVTWSDSEVDMMREVIYPNMEDYHLLLSKSQGTKYDNYLHDLTVQQQRDLADLTETIMGDVNRLEHVWSHCLDIFTALIFQQQSLP